MLTKKQNLTRESLTVILLLAAVAAERLTWHRQVQRIRLRFQRRLPRPKS